MKFEFSKTVHILIKLLIISVLLLLILFVCKVAISMFFSVDPDVMSYEECVTFYENNEADLQTVRDYFEDSFELEINKFEGRLYFGSAITITEDGDIENVYDEFTVDDEEVIEAIERLFENGCECITKLGGLMRFLTHKTDYHIEGIAFQGYNSLTNDRVKFTQEFTVRAINSDYWFYYYCDSRS